MASQLLSCCVWDPPSGVTALLVVSTLGLLLGQASPTDEVPYFIREPQDEIVKHNDQVTLHCDVMPKSARIRWRYNQELITSDPHSGVEIRKDGLHIDISKQEHKHSLLGVYQCEAVTELGAVVSREATVHRAAIGNFDSHPDIHLNATEGNVGLIECSPPKGTPRSATVFEVNNTITIDESSGRHRILPSGNLQIGKVKQSDQGTYQCIAVNPVSGHKRIAPYAVHLRVVSPWTNSPARIIKFPPSNTEIIRGQSLTLECVVEGAPVPVVTWQKYGGHLPNGRYTQVLGNLVIHDVESVDEGTYICRAENGVGPPQAAIAAVYVLEPPVIRIPPDSQVVTKGDSATLSCLTRGHPKVKMEWLHDGQQVDGSAPHVTVMDTSLTIDKVKHAHGGIYQCIARSKLGMTYSSALLRVQDNGQNSSDALADLSYEMQDIAPDSSPPVPHPVISLAPSNMSVEEGATVSLPCATEGHTTTVTWFKDGKPIQPSPRDMNPSHQGAGVEHDDESTPSGILQIFNVKVTDEGLYTCRAANTGGFVIASAFLTVTERHDISSDGGKVKMLPATSIGPTSASQGEPPAGDPVRTDEEEFSESPSRERGGSRKKKDRRRPDRKKKKVPTATLR